MSSLRFTPIAALVSALLAGAHAQVPGSSTLPPIAPTAASAPLAATSTPADRPGSRHHRAQVSCAGGQLEVRADNSSLNSILRAVAQCTGMKITGGVADQRVYGNYGPAMPATVIATLLDGTETNVLLKETAQDQPAELILTPRTAGPTPPSPTQVPEEDADDSVAPPAVPGNLAGPRNSGGNGVQGSGAAQPGSSGYANGPGAVSGPVSIPQPINNVLGSPNNTSPNAGTYPTTNSVPLDSLPTPSTTPNQTGIVSAPNPPAAGSDTAALLNGRTTNQPGNLTITDRPTTPAPSPGATNTQTNGGAGTGIGGTGVGSAAPEGQGLTPQQVVDQLQRMRQQQQSQSGNAGSSQNQNTTGTPQPQ